MESVGIRELKAHLSRHLKRVRAGARLVVTERGRAVATLAPVEGPDRSPEFEWAQKAVEQGVARWSGGKPSGAARPAVMTSGPTMADTVLEDRR
jgi:prevent-host-death family protein